MSGNGCKSSSILEGLTIGTSVLLLIGEADGISRDSAGSPIGRAVAIFGSVGLLFAVLIGAPSNRDFGRAGGFLVRGVVVDIVFVLCFCGLSEGLNTLDCELG